MPRRERREPIPDSEEATRHRIMMMAMSLGRREYDKLIDEILANRWREDDVFEPNPFDEPDPPEPAPPAPVPLKRPRRR